MFSLSQAGATSAVVLEEEVGTFGTALSYGQIQDADAEYEDRFQNDPGHVSRGEIRFNSALHDMGGRNPADGRRRSYRQVERRPNLRATPQWTAIPEPKVAKVAVNIVASAPAPSSAASSRLGMSDKEARSDLNSYFSTLAAQAKSQEKKHAEQVLGLSQGDDSINDSSSDDSSRTAKKVSTRQSLGASTHGEKVADKKVEALMKLVEKAAASKRFQEALVDASRDTFRGSIPGNFE